MGSFLSVVIGGGNVAERKVLGLLDAGARVRLISPDLTPGLQALVDGGQVEHRKRPYARGDLLEAHLVIAATDRSEVNQAIWQEAVQSGCLVNCVDDPQHSNFILPALLRRGDLTVAISTGGSSPALARRLREHLEALVIPEYADLTDLMGELREDLQARFPPGQNRLDAALRLVDSDLLDMIRRHGKEQARQYAMDLLDEAAAQVSQADILLDEGNKS